MWFGGGILYFSGLGDLLGMVDFEAKGPFFHKMRS